MDGLKSEIIYAISSEISAPLNRIMGTLHLLKTKIEGDELTEVVNVLDQSVLKLEQFSMLTQQISILKSPEYTLEKVPVPMKKLMQYSNIETKEELKDLDIGLTIDLESEDFEVKGDSDLLVSCLTNLILFAKEHTRSNGKIQIISPLSNGEIGCQVVDDGSNYSDTLFSLLKNQFSTTNPALNLSMGIGLAVSQIIMEAHGGQLIFEKTKDKQGKMKMIFPNE
jgi:signal transduction histidine kinase